MFKPYSNNIIFFDTEFSDLDPVKGEILSIGMVKISGEELYLEIEFNGETNQWVKENVLPTLNGPKVSKEEAIKKITEFVGKEKPFLIGYVVEFDAPFLYKLMGVGAGKTNKELPFHWITLDFASILFAVGKDPSELTVAKRVKLLEEFSIDARNFDEHHALGDAKALREIYLKLTAC